MPPLELSKLPAPTPLSAGLFLWGNSATRWLPAELNAEMRRASLTCRLLPEFPAVLNRIDYSALVGSSSGALRSAGPPEAIGVAEITPAVLPGALAATNDCDNAVDAGWSCRRPTFTGFFRRSSIGEDPMHNSPGKKRSSSEKSGPDAEASPGQTPQSSPKKLSLIAKSLSFNATRKDCKRHLSIGSAGSSASNQALLSLIKESNPMPIVSQNEESAQGSDKRLGFQDSAPDVFARQERVRVVWGMPTGDDKLRRQIMTDRVGALARSLGRPNNGMKQLKPTERDEHEITDLSEIMSYALREKQRRQTPKKQGWLYFCYVRIKNSSAGQPEKTAYTILITIATLIALVGYDTYYCLSENSANDDKILTVVFCVLCMFVIEFYCNLRYKRLEQVPVYAISRSAIVFKMTFGSVRHAAAPLLISGPSFSTSMRFTSFRWSLTFAFSGVSNTCL